jgi:hypothetical protein
MKFYSEVPFMYLEMFMGNTDQSWFFWRTEWGTEGVYPLTYPALQNDNVVVYNTLISP